MRESPRAEYPDIMEDMDGELLGLLKEGLDSFIKWDVIKFLYHHADAVHPADDLAQQMSRDQAALEAELNELVAVGIVDCCWVDRRPAFALATDKAARQVIEKFIHACDDRYFRMKVVYHILRGMN